MNIRTTTLNVRARFGRTPMHVAVATLILSGCGGGGGGGNSPLPPTGQAPTAPPAPPTAAPTPRSTPAPTDPLVQAITKTFQGTLSAPGWPNGTLSFTVQTAQQSGSSSYSVSGDAWSFSDYGTTYTGSTGGALTGSLSIASSIGGEVGEVKLTLIGAKGNASCTISLAGAETIGYTANIQGDFTTALCANIPPKGTFNVTVH